MQIAQPRNEFSSVVNWKQWFAVLITDTVTSNCQPSADCIKGEKPLSGLAVLKTHIKKKQTRRVKKLQKNFEDGDKIN